MISPTLLGCCKNGTGSCVSNTEQFLVLYSKNSSYPQWLPRVTTKAFSLPSQPLTVIIRPTEKLYPKQFAKK